MLQKHTGGSPNYLPNLHKIGTARFILVRFDKIWNSSVNVFLFGSGWHGLFLGTGRFLTITVIIIRRKELLPTVTISRVLITISPAFPAEMEILQEMNANPLRWRRRWWTTQFSIRIRVSPIWHGEMEKPTRKITTSVNFKKCLNTIFKYLYKIA